METARGAVSTFICVPRRNIEPGSITASKREKEQLSALTLAMPST
jgi:hypothetical protein